MKRIGFCIVASLTMGAASAQSTPKIHMVYMGGNDCPPCVQWRLHELPKLEQMDAFKSITFSHVQKSIGSTVPPAWTMPSEVRPYKDQLDAASGGIGGSAQVAIIVDGKLYDYYFGSRSADQVEQMILSIQNKTSYPFERCLRRDGRKCAVKG